MHESSVSSSPNDNAEFAASGHVFLLVHTNNSWLLHHITKHCNIEMALVMYRSVLYYMVRLGQRVKISNNARMSYFGR